MNKIIEWLKSIGWSEQAIADIQAHLSEEDVREYLMYLRAIYDDRREFVD